MQLSSIRNQFKATLKELYPHSEIENFFFLLAEFKLNFKRIDIALDPSKKLTAEEHLFFNDSLKKLLQETPIQYIIGSTEFYGLPFKVNSHTLIPRPETEELVQWILDDVTLTSKNTYLNILDIGTGSGCIPISLSKNLPKSKISGYDISEEALIIARQNAALNETSVNFKKIDILKTIVLDEKFDIIVSNPPYVRNLEKEEIQHNVLNHEPHLALFVENDQPLIFYEKIAELAKKSLKTNGYLYFEINQYLGKETIDILNKKGFKNIQLRKDIFENDRMIKAQLS